MWHFVAYGYPISCALGIALGGPWVFATGMFGSIALPVLDWIVRPHTVCSDGFRQDFERLVSEILLLLYPVVHYCLFVYAMYSVATVDYRWWELAGICYGLGLTGGACGFPVAHELIHRQSALARSTGLALLATPLYMHFRIEHIYGHHKTVGCPEDPATARRGESLYRFFARSLIDGFIDAWNIERRRLSKQGLQILNWKNRMLWYGLSEFCIVGIIWATLGLKPLAIFLISALLSVFLLETINYIEHYGLERGRLGDAGGYERVHVGHSWNSPHAISNAALFNLGLHADHHLRATKPFQELEHRAEAPQLPAGYFAMATLALIPPLWRKVMDSLIPSQRRSNPHSPHCELTT
jgi:alkane 1-monooxygenase